MCCDNLSLKEPQYQDKRLYTEEADPEKAYFTIMDEAIAAIRKIQEICKPIDYERMPT